MIFVVQTRPKRPNTNMSNHLLKSRELHDKCKSVVIANAENYYTITAVNNTHDRLLKTFESVTMMISSSGMFRGVTILKRLNTSNYKKTLTLLLNGSTKFIKILEAQLRLVGVVKCATFVRDFPRTIFNAANCEIINFTSELLNSIRISVPTIISANDHRKVNECVWFYNDLLKSIQHMSIQSANALLYNKDAILLPGFYNSLTHLGTIEESFVNVLVNENRYFLT